MKIKFSLFFPLIITFIECTNLKTSDLCFPIEGNEMNCHGFYHYNCGEYVCTKSQYSCHILSLFSVLKGPHQKKYEAFISKIKDCSQYTWNPNDVTPFPGNATEPSITTFLTRKRPPPASAIFLDFFTVNGEDKVRILFKQNPED